MADYHVTRKGYHRNNRTGIFEHVEVWERHHGQSVPEGLQIHHIDGDKLNNDPANLIALTPTEHKRVHSGCERRGDEWFKPCSICGEFKPITVEHWYISSEGWPLYGRCRPCHIAKVVSDKRLRRLRRAQSA